MLAEAETTTFIYDSGVWRHANLSADRSCSLSYQPPAAPGQNPAISPQTSGC